MERIVQPDSLALIDRVIYDLQAALSSVEWLTNIFGRARRQVRRVKGREVFFPAVYVGGGEYRSVLPDEMDGNFVWFDVPDYYTADIPPKQYGSVSATIRMVFWFDEETIFGRGISNRDRLKENVLAALRRALIRGGRFTVSRIGELNENIYRGYSIREIEAQHLIFPHGGFVVEGTAVAEERCGPYTPPVYVDTTDGTITPETVLVGEVGYAKGQRVIGTLDISKQIADAIDEGKEIGRAEILESQSDATITPDVVLAGYIGYGRGERIVGKYGPDIFPPERTKIWLEVETNPWIGNLVYVSVSNPVIAESVYIDWGDGTVDEHTGSYITGSHTYSDYGLHLISITPTNGMTLGAGISSYRIVGRNDTNATKTVRKVFAPAGVGVQYYCLTDCDSIEFLEFEKIQDTLPSSSIGCRGRYNLILHNTTPPSASSLSSAFTNFNICMKIYVPDESVNLYKSAWTSGGFRNAIYPISEYKYD